MDTLITWSGPRDGDIVAIIHEADILWFERFVDTYPCSLHSIIALTSLIVGYYLVAASTIGHAGIGERIVGTRCAVVEGLNEFAIAEHLNGSDGSKRLVGLIGLGRCSEANLCTQGSQRSGNDIEVRDCSRSSKDSALNDIHIVNGDNLLVGLTHGVNSQTVIASLVNGDDILIVDIVGIVELGGLQQFLILGGVTTLTEGNSYLLGLSIIVGIEGETNLVFAVSLQAYGRRNEPVIGIVSLVGIVAHLAIGILPRAVIVVGINNGEEGEVGRLSEVVGPRSSKPITTGHRV